MGSRQTCPKCQAAFFAGKSTAEAKAGAVPAAGAQPSYSKTMIGEAAPPIKYNCPRCKAALEAEGIEAGTKKNCPNCTQRHQVFQPTPRPFPILGFAERDRERERFVLGAPLMSFPWAPKRSG